MQRAVKTVIAHIFAKCHIIHCAVLYWFCHTVCKLSVMSVHADLCDIAVDSYTPTPFKAVVSSTILDANKIDAL